MRHFMQSSKIHVKWVREDQIQSELEFCIIFWTHERWSTGFYWCSERFSWALRDELHTEVEYLMQRFVQISPGDAGVGKQHWITDLQSHLNQKSQDSVTDPLKSDSESLIPTEKQRRSREALGISYLRTCLSY